VQGKGYGGVVKRIEPFIMSMDLVENNPATGQRKIVHEGFCGVVQWDQKLYNEPVVLPILNAHMVSAIQAREDVKRAIQSFYTSRLYRCRGNMVGCFPISTRNLRCFRRTADND